MRINDRGKWEYMGGKNPRIVPATFFNVYGPHSESIRFTYVVPKAKHSVLTSSELLIQRSTAATAAGASLIVLDHYESDGSKHSIQRAFKGVAVIDEHIRSFVRFDLPMNGGDVIAITTGDSSTGGTVNYSASLAIIEFDR